MGLKDIRTRADDVYEKLDEWIIANTYNQNESLKEIRSHISQIIKTTSEKLPDLKFNPQLVTIDDEINFIQMEPEQLYLDGLIRDKLAEHQLRDLFGPEGDF